METTDKPHSPEQSPVTESYDKKVSFEQIESLGIDFKNKTILELGSGKGEHTEYLFNKEPRMIVAVDSSKNNIDSLLKNFIRCNSVIPLQYDLNLELPVLEEKYDWIYSYGLINNLKNPINFIKNLSKINHTNLLLGINLNVVTDLGEFSNQLDEIYERVYRPAFTTANNVAVIICEEKKK
ncbi:MAG: class I SAM-dependent methyltransferase [Micavibrio sp.]|nr:class I SAM-dependent methyltransferase [Micavibrio sp.]